MRGLNAVRGQMMGGDEYRVLNKPRVFVYRTTAHNIPNGGAYTAIQWNAKSYDTDSMWNSAVNTTRLTCNTPGEYDVNGFVVWPSDSTNYRHIGIRVNGVATARFCGLVQPNAVTVTGQDITRRVTLNRGDYIELVLAQNTVTNPLVLGASPVLSTYDHGLQACLVSTLG